MRQQIEKTLNHHLMLPIKLFMGREKSGGIVLLLSVALAMVLANTNIATSYFHFFEQKVGFIINGQPFLDYSLHHWINDGLMAIFFFVVGLELKREFIGGRYKKHPPTDWGCNRWYGGASFDLFRSKLR